MGRARVGPGKEKVALGRAGGGGEEEEKGAGVGRPNGPGKGGKLISFLFFLSLFLLFQFDIM
jgi:hypothetical protein